MSHTNMKQNLKKTMHKHWPYVSNFSFHTNTKMKENSFSTTMKPTTRQNEKKERNKIDFQELRIWANEMHAKRKVIVQKSNEEEEK